MEYKKAIGPVVAVALLIVVSVVSVIGFQTWLGTYSSEIFSNAEIQSQSSTESTSIEALVGDQLYIKGENVSVKEVLIDGIKCNISVNISGIENVGLSDCLNSATSKTPEITVVTNDKVIIKKIYLKDIEVNSSSSSSGVNPVYTDTFISVWDTRILSSGEFPNPSESSNSSSITLPLVEGGTYNFFVDWGDGTNNTITEWNQSEVTHTYSSEGVYTIIITGDIIGFSFGGGGDRNKLLEIKAWGPLNVGNTAFYFYMCENFDYTGTDSLDLTGTISLLGMFAGASSFNGDISNWDVSSVTNMEGVFARASSFNGDISNWDVSSVTNMAGVFYEADSFNQLLNTWNVSSVTYMYLIFSGADSFNQDLSGWDVDQVTSCSSFNESAISWELVNQIDFIGKGSSCDPSPIIPE